MAEVSVPSGRSGFWSAWLKIALILCLVVPVSHGINLVTARLFSGASVSRAAPNTATFHGTIADTRCATSGKPAGLSHGHCMKLYDRGVHNVKYALYDGQRFYTLSDQQTPGKYLAQKVNVIGRLRSGDNTIEVERIQPAR
jgi:hypothetical protein